MPISWGIGHRLAYTQECGSSELHAHLKPIDDILLERQVEIEEFPGEQPNHGTAVFSVAEGPFASYQREVEYTEISDGAYKVDTKIRFRLSIPFWAPLLNPLVRRRLRRAGGGGGLPWWAPAERLDPRSAGSLGILCLLAVVAGYVGALLSQSISFATDELVGGADTQRVSMQGNVLSAVRLGSILALGAVWLADRRGRRSLLIACAGGACLAAVAGAASVGVWSFGTTQTVARGLATASLLLIAVMAAEEVPRGVRGYAVSVLGMGAGLGSGMVLWALPLADLGLRGWRILYLLASLGLLVVYWSFKRLPETRRYLRLGDDVAEDVNDSDKATEVGSHGKVAVSAGDAFSANDASPRRRRRLVLLGASSLLSACFAAPASQFLNEFLREERLFSASDITVYQLATYAPAGLGMLAAGKLSDLRGRRVIAVVCLLASPVCVTMRFIQTGWPMWLWGVLAGLAAGALVPVLGTYGSELFSTGLRARSNGELNLLGVAGSVVGLQIVGNLTVPLGGFGQVFGLLSIAPVAVAVLVLAFYPETAKKELEALNPEDSPGDLPPAPQQA